MMHDTQVSLSFWAVSLITLCRWGNCKYDSGFFHFRSGDGQYVILEDTLSDVSDWSSSLVSKAQQQVYATAHVTRCVQTGGEVFPVSKTTARIDSAE